MTYTLRPYQQKAIDDIYQWFDTHPQGNPVVEACVASGKSLLIAEFIRRALGDYSGTRILMAVHVKELVMQNKEKLLSIWPDAPVGILSASLKETSTGAQVIYGSIQTIAPRAEQIGFVNLMIVDECHMINPNGKDAGRYRKTIEALTQINPDFRVIGFTGTPFRGDGVWITQGNDPLFTHIISRIRIGEMMKQGYLSPMVISKTETQFDSSGIEIDKKSGDYRIDALADALCDDDFVKPAVAESIRLAEGRKKIMVFTANIGHCMWTYREYLLQGEAAAFVHSNMKPEERDETIAKFLAGEVRWLINVAILTTGFDAPAVDCLVLMRPTVSPVLYIQIAGRGLRLAEGKENCLWLDFTQTTASQGPIDAIKGRQKKQKREAPAPYKSCPECGHQCATATLVCGECGYEWPVKKPTLALSDAEIISSNKKPEWVAVRYISFHVHRKEAKPPTVCVSYSNGLMVIGRIYLSLHVDSNDWAFAKSNEIIRKHGGEKVGFQTDVGFMDICEELAQRMQKPSHVLVKVTDKGFPEILDFKFEEELRSEQG